MLRLAAEERRRVGLLMGVDGLVHRRRNLGLAGRAGVCWSAELGDPELQKNLRTYDRLIEGAAAIVERAETKCDRFLKRLRPRIQLPKDVPLTLELLLSRRFALERLLVSCGDEQYLRERLAELYDEGEGTVTNWKELFPDCKGTPALLAVCDAPGHTASPEEITATRHLLGRLLAVKEALDLPLRARRELKQRAVHRLVLPLLIVATVLFAIALGFTEDAESSFLLAAAAGATGACLGGLFKLRDELNRGTQMREFAPFFLGQVIVGAAAGLLVFVVDDSGVVTIGAGDSDSGVAALAFAVGFSEAALLGLLANLGGKVTDDKKNC